MQSKITLTEQFIIYDEIPSILKDKLNLNRIQTNILENYSDNKFQSDSVFNYHKDYVHVDDDHHIDEFDLWNSPDISCIYTLSNNEIPSDLIFEYDKGREKHARYRIPLFHNRFVLFNSELNHYLTPNKNDEPIVNLSFQFQLL